MFRKIWRWLFGSGDAQPANDRKPSGLFSTEGDTVYGKRRVAMPNWPAPRRMAVDGTAMDDDGDSELKAAYGTAQCPIPDAQLLWYIAQSFIGYQVCALLSQHWLIDKACTMPAKDAVRKGYRITADGGVKVDTKIMDHIRQADKGMKINKNMIEFLRMGRIFGIRVAKFVVESGEPEYYKKPFNIDGVKPGSYKGISQIDPYWITPELVTTNALEPGSMDFYEPEFWRVSGEVIHKSHLVIFTTGAVPDILKPAYYYGGVGIPQRVFERVYAAERTANEAPMLAMTKRLTAMFTDMEKAMSDEQGFTDRMNWWIANRDNYGVKFLGTDDKIEQFDLSLTDLDSVIMTQYQLVAAIAEVPGTKLLGTQPKGFNSTGEFEESSYHEMLESLRDEDLTRMLDRHYLLLIRSEVKPKFDIEFSVEIAWNSLDAMTAQQQAAVNLLHAQLDAVLIANGTIDSQESRSRLINDPDSGYSGLTEQLPPMPDHLGPDDGTGQPPASAPPKPTIPRATPIKGA